MNRKSVAVMSIRPRHASRIFAGTKPYEFRRRASGIASGTRILIYETAPVSAVTGEAAVEVVRAGSASELSSLEPEAAERETVLAYLGGARSPVALGLSGVVRYEKPKSLLEIGVAHAPQSYQFVEDPWDTSRS
ncbi:MAG: hypothetical protein J0I14_14350 [Propionibacteriaceae bacterium]|jgi:predicted transcriptional regulator|nr:hypothetical protein [Propionibacteriaceae bacterium]